MKIILYLSFFFIIIFFGFTDKNDYLLLEESVHLLPGIPKDNDTTDDYIIIRKQYALSYNYKRNVANWVAWQLNKDWFGDAPRYKGNFITDKDLPKNFQKITHQDYTNSGYDRGHMVRSEERTRTPEDNKSTFLLSNILPQTPDLNQGVWLDFEYFCEELCKNHNKELYIYAGGIFHSERKIKNKISIPDSCFKIVIMLNQGEKFSDINGKTKVYSVVMPNIMGIRKDKWAKYKTTIKRIEESTGYDFLSAIPDSIEIILENK